MLTINVLVIEIHPMLVIVLMLFKKKDKIHSFLIYIQMIELIEISAEK